MRGKPRPCRGYRSRLRNIPAYAGKTSQQASATSPASEHPRVCGENVKMPASAPSAPGTSPRMRGKRSKIALRCSVTRNIPAYAGKTSGNLLRASELAGTSPRMRGKREELHATGLPRRNIPAYAGKTDTASRPNAVDAEHPRVCGENRPCHSCVRHARGTSPRMRGKPKKQAASPRPRRNIPAYAGKTEGDCLARVTLEEHPRVCGENSPKPTSPIA